MLEHYRRLFEFNQWAKERLLLALDPFIGQESSHEKLMKVVSHIFMAERLWLGRIRRDDFTPSFLKAISLLECRALEGELRKGWTDHFEGLNEASFSQKVAYRNLKGEPFENSLSDILTHVINHGSYHRGQVASLLKAAGGGPLETDYIAFARQTKK